MSTPPDEKFLSRWSRRKRAGEEDEPVSQVPEPAEVPPEPEPTDETDEEILARLELPDPDTMEKGDDFSRFMASAVPEHIRRRALRKLWRSNPTLVVLDGLNEYDDDYTKGFVPAGTLKTAYKVGRGFLSKLEETASAETAEVADTDEADAEAAYAPDNNAQELDAPSDMEPEPVAEDTGHAQEDLDAPEPEAKPTRRRMQFRLGQNE